MVVIFLKTLALFFFVFLLSVSGFSLSSKESSFIVAIDAGHGGHDAGTQFENLKESFLTLSMARDLIKIHEAATSSSELSQPAGPNQSTKSASTLHSHPNKANIQFKLIRTDNNYKSLSSRLQLAQKLNADLFISLHVNSSPTSMPEGVEIYFNDAAIPIKELEGTSNEALDTHQKVTESNTEVSDLDFILNELKSTTKWKKSLALTNNIHRQLQVNLKNTKSVIKKEAFYVLNNSPMPSVLLELGFLSNPQDRERLLDDNYRKSLLKNVYTAIMSTSLNLKKQKDSL